MSLSPDLREKMAKFRGNRRAWWSLLILGTLFILSLPAEFLFTDKPLILSIEGEWYFPCVKEYSLADFGGDSDIPITNYNSRPVKDFLQGITREADVEGVFGGGDEFDDEFSDEDIEEKPAESATAGPARESWMLRAPFHYDHKSSTIEPKTGRVALVAPYRRYEKHEEKWIKSSWQDRHWLGTDKAGKDVLARLVYGFRISMLFGLGLAITGTFIGTIIGAVQGYFGGWVDLIGQRLTEMWGSLPRLFLLIILSSFLSNVKGLTDTTHILMLFFILNLTAWMGVAAYVRAEFLKARNLDYVKAAKALGQSDARIMWRHILPNSLTPIITFFPFEATAGILALASLDFLNLGVAYPAPSLGELIGQGKEHLYALWIIVPTFLVLVITLSLLTFVGDGVRNAFDPRHSDD
jgi:microcin C transport system permease protein